MNLFIPIRIGGTSFPRSEYDGNYVILHNQAASSFLVMNKTYQKTDNEFMSYEDFYETKYGKVAAMILGRIRY